MILDGLWDKYNNIHMGNCAENCAKNFKMSREEVDNFAIESYERAIKATSDGKFTDEIIDLKITSRKGEVIINIDEEPTRVMFEKIKTLNPAFDSDGIITAANASKINDGAAALLVCSEEKANEMGLKPLVEIIGQSSAAKAPIDFTIAPADAINKVLLKTNMNVSDIDLYEINEAFAVVSIAVNKLLGLKTENVNVNGGAIALGHPIGASGARILVTLIHELKRRSLEYGLASLCIGGGEASAIIVKNLI
jgi:acetyl-CoA C-acetyltransferase